jgi:hypothetical protein
MAREVRRSVLPIPDQPGFGLVTYDARDPDTKFPPIEPVKPPQGAPNVLVILLDDVGFGAASAFGGPCSTPDLAHRPQLITGSSQLLFPGMKRLSENSVVSIKNKSFSVTAQVTVPDAAEGVIISRRVSTRSGWSSPMTAVA